MDGWLRAPIRGRRCDVLWWHDADKRLEGMRLAVATDEELCAPHDGRLSHEHLLRVFRKGLRNGNWRRLGRLEKALYMASLWYARVRGFIVNELVVRKLKALVDKLTETVREKIFMRGLERAMEILEKYEERGVFAWAPSVREWLSDPDFIFWLGRSA
ncbi:MAG: hypothetical protein OD815_000013 [Candidatus Alkanophagales archaeon MCA70_species_2]|nr:hypothetical protein [Candidatus Alkanophaga liquidiphilum]